MRIIKEIIVHCSGTEDCQNIGVDEIRDYHQRVKGWRDCGYHYIVRLDGTVESGRYISQPGAHCIGHNAHSIGVCYIGGIHNGKPRDTRTQAQKQALLKLIYKLVKMYHCPVYGHRDFSKKDCPCFDAKKEYGQIWRREVKIS